MNKKRLRRHKQQAMQRRGISGKKPMSDDQKAAREKLRETVRIANEIAHPKKI